MKHLMTAALILILAACANKPKPKTIGMPNPAAVFCLKQGGTLIPKTDASGGQYALCLQPDGTQLEEWAYFHARSQH